MSAGELTSRLEAAFSVPLGASELLAVLLPLLADGKAVAPAALTEALAWPAARVADLLARLPNVERDASGNIVGLGLSLNPTPHVFEIRGRHLYTWCALDALLFPAVLGETARVSSPCAATGAPIRLVVSPERVEEVFPRNAVVSLVLPSADPDLRATFCDRVRFFVSKSAAGAWLRAHPGGLIVSVDDAYTFAEGISARVFGAMRGPCC
jgi:alkylmercury lyase